MKLMAAKRTNEKKSEAKKLRREGEIPAVLYSSKHPCESIFIKGVEFSSVLRNLKLGRLPTTIFTLQFADRAVRAIVKDIQYTLTRYQVSHLDFEEIRDDTPVNVKIPITLTNTGECAGVKLGGFLRQIVRYVEVQCLPQDIPLELQVDVKDLGIRQSKRVADIVMPAKVKPLMGKSEVLVVVAK